MAEDEAARIARETLFDRLNPEEFDVLRRASDSSGVRRAEKLIEEIRQIQSPEKDRG